ncbi:MAG: hypothetical protein JJ913_02395 [Rhizobiaceae bacterium]|nr:hypothetical protein [Rhizobiaceae bacterium]
MEGEPAYRRDDPPEALDTDHPALRPTSDHRRSSVVPLVTLAFAFGLAAAVLAVVRSGVLSAEDGMSSNGNWRVSALLIGIISGTWFAGAVHLVRLAWPGTANTPAHSAWPATLAAFAAGPLLLALFFFGTGLARFPGVGIAAYLVAASIVLVLLFARRGTRLLAERLLASFMIWLGILVAPTFWRDPVNDQFTGFLFDLLQTVGLL